MSKEKAFRKNHQIKAAEIRLIGSQGEQIGIVSLTEALRLADEESLDLVEVNPTINPPICKIIDFGKMQYEQEKKDRKQKAKQKKVEVKGIRLSVNIAENDLMIRVKQAQKFMDKGNKVNIELMLRGRQKAHPDKAHEIIKQFINTFPVDTITIESPIKRMGGKFTCLITNKNNQ